MKIFLAGSGWDKIVWRRRGFYDFNRLESFYIIGDEREDIHKYKAFLLDSGAFSYMSGKRKDATPCDWDAYIEEYAKFINRWDVQHFFELDIDVLVGLEEVDRLRAKLENLTGKQAIPVWHKSRGLDYWKRMVEKYDYVAIGGIVTKEIKRSEYGIFHTLLRIARENRCKVHGLGFTNLKTLLDFDFYSVDSTSWLGGNRFGFIYHFNGRSLDMIKRKPNQRVKAHPVAHHNFEQWMKFNNYIESIT